jgi:hypothetical protein
VLAAQDAPPMLGEFECSYSRIVGRCPADTNVRVGSIASVWPRTDDFRSTPINRHR